MFFFVIVLACTAELCYCEQVSEVTQIDPLNLQFAKVCNFCCTHIFYHINSVTELMMID